MAGRTTLLVTGGLALAGFTVAFVLAQPTKAVGLLTPDDAELVAIGQIIYAEQCAACHGARLEGQPNWRIRGEDGLLPAPPHDATGHTWHHDDETLFTLTKFGLAGLIENAPATGMPVYEGVLSDDEIIAVLSFIKSTWSDDLREYHDELNTQSE
ncbi:Cytochrome C oxidase, cbb3-type, subunit III [Ruegeria halocynthiae]|uniref:Cytochrome C oxidase, cbb3-type, subunit III n=1 Tax=Ruegeria halocynthiae TaxID=985054 RepID=A0A1H3D820_9RHOB|nr:cytochrome c [Ruegeria halocynthiae]SDX62476.1 Cytochrome C oxidase, cbb3-type, subunit III [Ruegeria halocynthiae]